VATGDGGGDVSDGHRSSGAIRLSALVVARNEEARLADCLSGLLFADEIVIVLDRCTDGSKAIAGKYTDRIVEGAWEREGDRRNAGIGTCRGWWILEIDADERVPKSLANEIGNLIGRTDFDIFDVPVDNYVGGRLVRHGWMAAIGTSSAPRLFRKGVKQWGPERVHPHLQVDGRQGPRLGNAIVHLAADNISDLLLRLDRNTTWRARDLAERGEFGSFPDTVRKIFSRFWKCYVLRAGYREDGHGFVIALCAALYPVIAHLKARLELAK
jgi:glycosyltransferase involved in cell wall biosynthesis